MKINNKEKVKDFNGRFTILLKRVLDKPVEVVQIEFYTTSLLPPIVMFVKRENKQTLAENLEEAIKVEKYLGAISKHLENEENNAFTPEKNGKKNNQTSKIDSNEKYKVILQLQNEIMNIKRNKGEGKSPFKLFIQKSTNVDTHPHVPPTLGVNLEDYAMANFCQTHHANHFEKKCHEFINSFSAMFLPPKHP